MTKQEQLDRLKTLESVADDCIHEICAIIGEYAPRDSWYNISDDIQDKISGLQAEIDFEKSGNK